MSTDGTSSSEATSSEATSGGTTSSGAESSSTGAPMQPPPWVVTVVDGAPPSLRAIELDGGEVVDVCALAGVDRPDGLAFLPDDRLVGTVAATTAIWIADPCDCTVLPIDTLEPPLALHAIAERHDAMATIVGADASRGALFGVHVDVPELLPLGELAIADAVTALAAIPDSDELNALAHTAGMHLLRIDPASGSVLADAAIALPDDAAGLTRHPADPGLVACDPTGTLWRVDPDDASTEALPFALPAPCHTLATAHAPLACIDELFTQ